MLRKILLLAVLAGMAAPSIADENLLQDLLKENSYEISMAESGLHGVGADFISRESRNAQFVVIGEGHNVLEIPQFTTALFSLLHEQHEFNYFATEQDPLMMQLVSREPARGKLDQIVALAKKYPYGLTFASDQEQAMLADIASISNGRSYPVWGAEQAFGATQYLDALLDTDLNSTDKATISSALPGVRKAEQKRDIRNSHYMANGESKAELIQQLKNISQTTQNSEAEFYIDALVKSDEIYNYYFRAVAGEAVGLFNNTVREAYIKKRFVQEYNRAKNLDKKLPRVLLKYGSNHTVRGRNPTNAYPIGNFVSELAIANDMESFSILLVAYGSHLGKPDSIRDAYPLFAQVAPEQEWQITDLRPLRQYYHARKLNDDVAEELRKEFSRIIFGYDAILYLPGGHPATYELTGWEF
jgi:hypothetical protein